jgi:hypothetical protein
VHRRIASDGRLLLLDNSVRWNVTVALVVNVTLQITLTIIRTADCRILSLDNYSLNRRFWIQYSIFRLLFTTLIQLTIVLTLSQTQNSRSYNSSNGSPEPCSCWGFIASRRRMRTLLACHWLARSAYRVLRNEQQRPHWRQGVASPFRCPSCNLTENNHRIIDSQFYIIYFLRADIFCRPRQIVSLC